MIINKGFLKNKLRHLLLLLVVATTAVKTVNAKDYYVHPKFGNDLNVGNSKENAFKSLFRLEKIKFNPGDRILLASNEVYDGSLILVKQHGTKEKPIEIQSVKWLNTDLDRDATIDFKGYEYGLLLEDCSYIQVSNINITANGYILENKDLKMRCGVLVKTGSEKQVTDISLNGLLITDIYYENQGFTRNKEEVKSANGTQKYGWGIRLISYSSDNIIENISIENCSIANISHTGIKLTGSNKNIKKVNILNNNLFKTGGPGIQMSGVKDVYVAHNKVHNSGSNNDGRKWGRGSGLWTWGSSNVMIEKNEFLNANGPGDSAGAHIDYNCDNIIIQYNLSANNAGGFCEILGNNYNCTYRYNISVNDGYRIKGIDGAFQEGKTLWLSGYQGEKMHRKGPVNSYIYNNTIYTDAKINPKVAFDNTSKGLVMVNNIFYLSNPAQLVIGDQYKPDSVSHEVMKDLFFKSNLYLTNQTWPKATNMIDGSPVYGKPKLKNPGSLILKDYIPLDIKLIKNKGIKVIMPNDVNGLINNSAIKYDILDNPIPDVPSIGAIEPNL